MIELIVSSCILLIVITTYIFKNKDDGKIPFSDRIKK